MSEHFRSNAKRLASEKRAAEKADREAKEDGFKNAQLTESRKQNQIQIALLLLQTILGALAVAGLGLSLMQTHAAEKSASAAVKSADLAVAALNEAKASRISQEDAAKQTIEQATVQSKEATDASREALIKQIKAATDNVREEERPYLAVDVPQDDTHFREGERANLNLAVFNYGKTPALLQHHVSRILVGHGCLKQADQFFSDLDQGLIEGQKLTSMPRNDTVDFPSQNGKMSSYMTATSLAKLSRQDLFFLTHEDHYFCVVARVWYEDTHRSSFSTDFCVSHLSSGATADCPTHNALR